MQANLRFYCFYLCFYYIIFNTLNKALLSCLFSCIFFFLHFSRLLTTYIRRRAFSHFKTTNCFLHDATWIIVDFIRRKSQPNRTNYGNLFSILSALESKNTESHWKTKPIRYETTTHFTYERRALLTSVNIPPLNLAVIKEKYF